MRRGSAVIFPALSMGKTVVGLWALDCFLWSWPALVCFLSLGERCEKNKLRGRQLPVAVVALRKLILDDADLAGCKQRNEQRL